MKIDRLETHDRLLHFGKQTNDISECCQNLINQKPFGDHPFYIFAHARTIGLDEKVRFFQTGKYLSFDQIPEKTIIWQPRLTKPKAQENSMLFKAYPGTDIIKILWMIPAIELWDQYEKGKMTESETVLYSINMYKTCREELERKEQDDLPDDKIDLIYKEISRCAQKPSSNKIIF